MHLQAKTLKVSATGASKAELEGAVETLSAEIAGASVLEAEDLKADDAHINCAGAGVAEVHVAKQLWAQAAGASKITYRGKPNVQHQMTVGGSQISAR